MKRESVGPFMKVFGSCWSAAKAGRYPEPEYETIYECHAGGAGYSCAHHERQIILRESHPELCALWIWLIHVATEAMVREIPILGPGEDIQKAELSAGQALLVKWRQRTNNHGTKTWIVSPWGNRPGQWTESTRSRIAEQVSCIKHWRICGPGHEPSMPAVPVTRFCDPPYLYNYRYGARLPDDYHARLGAELLEWEGDGHQVIACEAIGKNGERPDYLPFRDSHKHRSWPFQTG